MIGIYPALLERPDSPPPTGASAAPPAPAARRPRPWHVEAAAVALGTAATAVQAARLGHWLVDDAAITFAYARSIDEGHGPVQQSGAEAVEGYSNPSWLVLLVIGRRLGLFDSGTTVAGIADLVWFPKLLALLCVAAILVAVTATARAAFPGRPLAVPAVTLVAGAAMAGNFSWVVWLFSGLENPLYALAVSWLTAVAARAAARGTLLADRTATATGLLALLAALTRPDGAAYVLAYPVVLLLFVRRAQLDRAARQALRSLAVFAVPYGAFLLWRRVTFGRWLPNTAVAKSQGAPALGELARTGELLTYAGWLLVLVLAGCVGLALSRPGRARRTLAAVLVPLALGLGVYGALAPDWMALYRFASPVWSVGALAAGLALVAARPAVPARGRPVLVTATVAALALSFAGRQPQDTHFVTHPTVPMCHIAQRYGQTFNSYADQLGLRNATVALPDLGGTLLTSRLTVLDLAGLTDRTVADGHAARDGARIRDHVLREVRPEFVHVQGAWARRTGLSGEVLAGHGYVLLAMKGDGGDWLRMDAVRDPSRVDAVRAWAQSNADRLERRRFDAGTAGCGDTLLPGRAAPGRPGGA
ncbi:hypothetical protein ACIQM4_20140 [Streptomyces sp. NPDC091272]|uniref:hypothetical protein n=1 Tax=Streptomyces sp. NPDC091272 TaxID=3365981 RepID=UPI0037F67317